MRLYEIESTHEPILLKSSDVWHYADKERLLGRRDTTIYMTYFAYSRRSSEFDKLCSFRNITVEVVNRI